MGPKLTVTPSPLTTEELRLARQVGVEGIAARLNREEWGAVLGVQPLLQLRRQVEEAGLALLLLESALGVTRRIRQGLPGRDEDIEAVCKSLRNMGAADIPLVTYSFALPVGYYRTSRSTRTRGDALVSSFDYDLVRHAPSCDDAGSEEQVWEHWLYFMERVLPVAEEARVRVALHPDDPPITGIEGIARPFRSVAAFDRVLALAPSDYHGLSFCQGCFAEMGEDIPATIRHFGEKGRIFSVHFRNIAGTTERFMETFHDDGQVDMFAAMRVYYEVGYEGPIGPDHVPRMEGDSPSRPVSTSTAFAGGGGSSATGRVFALGYMRGLMQAAAATMGQG